MSDHNDPRSNHPSTHGTDAAGHDDDYLDTVFDADEPYDGADQTFGQDNSYDPLSDDLFAQGDSVTFSDEKKQADRSKWMIIGGAVLIAVALILALKLLSGGSEEPEVVTPPAPVQTQPVEAPAADTDELALLPTEIEAAMPTTQKQAEEQIDALSGEQELLDEQLTMYEEQLATSEKISELKAAQIAALEKQLGDQSSASTAAGTAAVESKAVSTPAAKDTAQNETKPTTASVSDSVVAQP